MNSNKNVLIFSHVFLLQRANMDVLKMRLNLKEWRDANWATNISKVFHHVFWSPVSWRPWSYKMAAFQLHIVINRIYAQNTGYIGT
jgi:hypothetical protein